MPTSYTTRSALSVPANADRAWDIPLVASLNALEAVNAIGAGAVTVNEHPSATLTVKVAPITFISSAGAYVTYAGGTLTVSPSVTIYAWLTDAGVLASGTGWPAAGTKVVRLAVVTSGGSTITGIVDGRVFSVSAG